MDTLVCAFSQYCKTKYTAEIVEVVYPDNEAYYYPDLEYRTEEIDHKKAINYIGIKYVKRITVFDVINHYDGNNNWHETYN